MHQTYRVGTVAATLAATTLALAACAGDPVGPGPRPPHRALL
jgi:hypothetical protein